MWKTIFQSNEWPKNTRDFTETYYRGSMPGESRKRRIVQAGATAQVRPIFVIVAMFRRRCSPECHSASICSVEHESLSHPRNHGAIVFPFVGVLIYNATSDPIRRTRVTRHRQSVRDAES